MINFLCEAVENHGINVNLTSIFTFIGMAFSIVVSVVALVWLTCFVVRLLIKTFKAQVQSSYDIFVENTNVKANSKKERNALKRQAKDARKLEVLNIKQEHKERIHQMKVNKLGVKLMENEEKVKEKLGGTTSVNVNKELKTEPASVEVVSAEEKVKKTTRTKKNKAE